MRNIEDKLQSACVTYFRLQYPNLCLYAIPNGGSRNPIEAAKLKRTGTLPGVADLFLMTSSKSYHGLFIEMKAGKGKQTPHQLSFEQKAWNAGFMYVVVRSFDEFKEIIENYLSE